jgi:hypothetical protein
MSVVSRYADDRVLYPQRRVYTAPEQRNYSGLEYLDPNNLNQKIKEEQNPTDFALPQVIASQNVYDPTRRPSDNLSLHRMGVPLQCDTYDLLDSRRGASVFNAPIPEVGPKLRTLQEIAHHDYVNNLTRESISFTDTSYPTASTTDELLGALLVHSRPKVKILNSIINEPVGQVFRETFNGAKAHRNVNAAALEPAALGQDELRMFQRTGRWC